MQKKRGFPFVDILPQTIVKFRQLTKNCYRTFFI